MEDEDLWLVAPDFKGFDAEEDEEVQEFAKGGEVSIGETKFNSHKNHNPNCDIIEGRIDKDSFLCYGIDIKGEDKGKEFCEYYRGSNYNVGSNEKSYSRHFSPEKIPSKFKKAWEKLRTIYKEKYMEDNSLYAHGGSVHQAAAQGKNYNWRTDRGETAKHVGWRYTDAGAKRLGVKPGNIPTQAHIEKYDGREFIANGKKHRYIYKETRKDKSDISPKKKFEGGGEIPSYFGSGKNIEIFGYTTLNFDICGKAVSEFERAASEIEAMGTEHETMVISMREALVRLAKLVDELFGIEKKIYETKLPADRSTHTLIALNIMPNIGINNYKSGMHVDIAFLADHIQNICEYRPAEQKVEEEEMIPAGAAPDPFPIIEKEHEEQQINQDDNISEGDDE